MIANILLNDTKEDVIENQYLSEQMEVARVIVSLINSEREYLLVLSLYPDNVLETLIIDENDNQLVIAAFDNGKNMYSHFKRIVVSIEDIVEYIYSDIVDEIKDDFVIK